MRSPLDPIRSWKRRIGLTWVIGLTVAAPITVWSLLPLSRHSDSLHGNSPGTLSQLPNSVRTSPEQPSIDPTVFAAAIWNPPPPPPGAQSVNQAAIEPAKPLNLQLIGIINESGTLKAAVYDMDADRLLIVVGGDRIREQTVTSVTASSVELSDGRSSRKLILKQEAIGS